MRLGLQQASGDHAAWTAQCLQTLRQREESEATGAHMWDCHSPAHVQQSLLSTSECLSMQRYSHYDVVAAGKCWNTDPWKMVAKDGYFYGRGVSDNKGDTCRRVRPPMHIGVQSVVQWRDCGSSGFARLRVKLGVKRRPHTSRALVVHPPALCQVSWSAAAATWPHMHLLRDHGSDPVHPPGTKPPHLGQVVKFMPTHSQP